jgi:protein disulfide-isomerase A6
MDAYRSVGQPYDVKGFPTIKLFGLNKNSPTDYNGGRDANSIINFALDQAKNVARARSTGSSGSGSSNSGSNFGGNSNSGGSCSGGAGPSGGSGSTCGGSGGSGSSSGGSSGSANSGPSNVVTLTSANFDSKVYNSKSVWLIEFYAPWCGHCKKLQPEWEAAATKLKNMVTLGKVNCDEEQSVCQQFGVRGYPTIKYFTPGTTAPGQAQEYQGGRDESGIVKVGTELFTKYGGDLELNQLVNQASFKKECLESEQSKFDPNFRCMHDLLASSHSRLKPSSEKQDSQGY